MSPLPVCTCGHAQENHHHDRSDTSCLACGCAYYLPAPTVAELKRGSRR